MTMTIMVTVTTEATSEAGDKEREKMSGGTSGSADTSEYPHERLE
jgi:hypothetical protein